MEGEQKILREGRKNEQNLRKEMEKDKDKA